MINDYLRIDDEVYTINLNLKLICHTSVTKHDNNMMKSFYNEYKTSNKKYGSVVVKRRIENFLTLESCIQGQKNSVMITMNMMFDVIEKLTRIKTYWFDIENQYVFGFVGGEMVIVNNLEHIIILCPQDKFIRIDPIVNNKNGKNSPAVLISVNDTSNPIIVTEDRINGLLWVLSTTDWMNFSNTSLLSISMNTESCNRTDFTINERGYNTIAIPEEDTTTKRTRDFSYKKKSFFDK